EVGLPHLVLEIDRQYFLRPFSHSISSKNNALISVDAGQGERDMLRDMVTPAERHGGPTGRDSSAQKTTQILTQRLAIRRLTADSRGYTCGGSEGSTPGGRRDRAGPKHRGRLRRHDDAATH